MASVDHINRANLVWQIAARQNSLASKFNSLKDLTKKASVTGAGGDVGAYAGGEGGGGRGGGRKAQVDTAAPEPSVPLQLLDVDAGLTAEAQRDRERQEGAAASDRRGGGGGARAGAGEHGARGGGKLIGLFDDVILMM